MPLLEVSPLVLIFEEKILMTRVSAFLVRLELLLQGLDLFLLSVTIKLSLGSVLFVLLNLSCKLLCLSCGLNGLVLLYIEEVFEFTVLDLAPLSLLLQKIILCLNFSLAVPQLGLEPAQLCLDLCDLVPHPEALLFCLSLFTDGFLGIQFH